MPRILRIPNLRNEDRHCALLRLPWEGSIHHVLAHVVSRSMILMIATALLLFCVPSVVMPLAQVHTSPFLAVNCLSFCTTASSPSVMWQSMSFIIALSGVL